MSNNTKKAEYNEQEKEIHFNAEGSEVLRLSQNGFHYKGQTIDDAGEAYKLFKAWLNKAQEQE